MTPSAPPSIPESRVALVTGASGGIGRGIVAALRAHGIVTVAADVVALEEWPDDHPADHRIQVDVRESASCAAAVDYVIDHVGRLDHVVNNAAIIRRGPAESLAVEDFEAVLDVNLTGAFRMTQAAFGPLSARGGSIVNVASTNGVIASPGKVAYCASKAGLIHMTRTLAAEWADRKIRVNAVAPTLVETEINADKRADPVWLGEQLANIPLGRAATIDEVAAAVTFLLSDSAGMTTGQVLCVDGGSTL